VKNPSSTNWKLKAKKNPLTPLKNGEQEKRIEIKEKKLTPALSLTRRGWKRKKN
jgi:hypothetical protein